MPVTPHRNILFAVLLLLPVLGSDAWGAVSVETLKDKH
jgi:hypothetical protein